MDRKRTRTKREKKVSKNKERNGRFLVYDALATQIKEFCPALPPSPQNVGPSPPH